MIKLTLLIPVLFLSLQLSATEWTYNHLVNLYDKDAKQCLIVAKRYIKYFPEKAAAYYFASMVYLDKIEKAKNARGEYLHLKKAISYAAKFEKLEDTELMDEIQWEAYLILLENESGEVLENLNDESRYELVAQLESKVNDFFESSSTPEYNESTTTEMNTFSENSSTETQFFGMPQGTEIIQSHDLNSEQDMLKIINTEREKKGMNPLVWEEDLAKAARYHAFDLGSQNYFAHSSYDRNDTKLVKVGGTFERIKKFYTASFVNSENIAAGNEQPELTYGQWYNSKGHYENMFNSYSNKVGIGVCYIPGSEFGYYWVFCTAL